MTVSGSQGRMPTRGIPTSLGNPPLPHLLHSEVKG